VKEKFTALLIVQLMLLNAALIVVSESHAEQTPPEIYIAPKHYMAEKLHEIFNITVNIRNLQASHKAISVQFRVQYDASLLEAVDAYEGPFIKQFGNTYFIKYIEDDPYYGPNVLIGIQLLPNETGHWITFPDGSGTLATITFKATSQPSGGPLQSILQLNDTILTDDSIEEIPHTTVSGVYTISALTFTYEPLVPSAGEVVTFSLKEPENHVPIIYKWDFGDGVIVNTTKPTVTHMYKTPGDYNVTLTCIIEGAKTSTTKTISIKLYPPSPLEIDMDVSQICFPGEIVEFNILIKHYGERVDPDTLSALLYYNGGIYANLTATIQRIDIGLYRINYRIPNTAEAGTYTLLVDARYYIVKGTCIKSFAISPTLTQWNARLLFINGTIATISTDVGIIKIGVEAINFTLVGINGTVAYISSTLGTIMAGVNDINATLVRLDGTVAYINSTVGPLVTPIRNINLTVTEIKRDMATGQMVATIQTTLGTIKGYVEDVNDGGLATINTEIGMVKTNISTLLQRVPEKPPTVDMTPSWVAAIFAILAFLAVIFLLLKKK